MTFGQWQGYELSEDNHLALYIPGSFAHGFMALERSIVSYKCDEGYYPQGDDGIKHNDADIAIRWPIATKVIISERDNKLQIFAEYIQNNVMLKGV